MFNSYKELLKIKPEGYIFGGPTSLYFQRYLHGYVDGRNPIYYYRNDELGKLDLSDYGIDTIEINDTIPKEHIINIKGLQLADLDYCTKYIAENENDLDVSQIIYPIYEQVLDKCDDDLSKVSPSTDKDILKVFEDHCKEYAYY